METNEAGPWGRRLRVCTYLHTRDLKGAVGVVPIEKVPSEQRPKKMLEGDRAVQQAE